LIKIKIRVIYKEILIIKIKKKYIMLSQIMNW